VTDTIAYRAAGIITMDKARPDATHVLVRDGRILAVGSATDLAPFGPFKTDERFMDRYLMPGFIEGHMHLDSGNVWKMVYTGTFARTDPDGRHWPGLGSVDAVLDRLAAHKSNDPETVLMAWGFDPLLLGTDLTRHDLDKISDSQPIMVWHASGHIMVGNTPALKKAGMFPPPSPHKGIPLGADGLPIGDLRGIEVMVPAAMALGILDKLMNHDGSGARPFSRMCVRAGITTATDLANPLTDLGLKNLTEITARDDFPIRLVPALMDEQLSGEKLVAKALGLKAQSTDKLRLGTIKLIADGSIQGFTARLLAPGYYNGADNGLWYMAPERLAEVYKLAMAAGIQVNTHTNGDEATELALDCLQAAVAANAPSDHRFIIQHAQLTNTNQFRRMKTLGACVNLFANHLYYWGDAHCAFTVGPARAELMNNCRSALDAGVPLAIHCDEPVTPMSPLFTAWCAVNRLSGSGRLLGAGQRITVAEALYAITMGAAYTMKLDAELGSISPGKCADFAILEDDPISMPPSELRHVKVWGTMLGGRIFSAQDI
jgi:predicted amidohydrolase YtcJ